MLLCVLLVDVIVLLVILVTPSQFTTPPKHTLLRIKSPEARALGLFLLQSSAQVLRKYMSGRNVSMN